MSATDKIHAAARAWFVRLNDDQTSEADWLAFLDWTEADEAHRLAYDRVEQLWAELDEPLETTPANDIGPKIRRRAVWLVPAMAAGLVLALGVGSTFLGERAQVYRTGDQPRLLALEDGSRIVLNRRSEMTVRLRHDSRDITLVDGEAAFDVAHDQTRPFSVSANGHDIRVLGTAFNVLSHQDRFSVSVARGVVAVTPRQDSTVRLTAGRRIDQVGKAASVISTVDPAETSPWRDGVLIYRNADVAEIATDLSRYLDKPVRVSPSTRDLRYTGVLTLGAEPTMLKQLEDLLPVEAKGLPDAVVLSRRDAD